MVELENDERNTPPFCTAATPKRDSVYYFERGNLLVQVENTLFKISDIKFWTHSDFFYLVSGDNGMTLTEKAQQPRDDEGGIWKLKDVKVEDFTRLLWILYPEDHGACKVTTVEGWESVLKLADRWRFNDIFNMAADKLASLSIGPIRKIGIMHRHQIRKEWVIDALVQLTLEPNFPDSPDTEILGLEMTAQLARTREKVSQMHLLWARNKAGLVKGVVCGVYGLASELAKPVAWKA